LIAIVRGTAQPLLSGRDDQLTVFNARIFCAFAAVILQLAVPPSALVELGVIVPLGAVDPLPPHADNKTVATQAKTVFFKPNFLIQV
jgi:hypothetical protein